MTKANDPVFKGINRMKTNIAVLDFSEKLSNTSEIRYAVTWLSYPVVLNMAPSGYSTPNCSTSWTEAWLQARNFGQL